MTMKLRTRNWLDSHFNLNAKSMEIGISLCTFFYGLWLFHAKSFFYYPPALVWLMDSPWVDLLVAFLGALLFIFALIQTKDAEFEKTRANIVRTLLVLIVFVTLILGLLKLEHVYFAGDKGMAGSAIQDLTIAFFTFLTCSAA